MRDDYRVLSSGVDLCNPIGDADADRARQALANADVVGLHEEPQSFLGGLSLDLFDSNVHSEAWA
jgi:hypothetical protein